MEPDFSNDKAALKSALSDSKNADAVYAITVGSEVLWRGDLKPEQLLEKIQDVEKQFPNFKVGFADVWVPLSNGTADPLIKAGVKLMYV